MKIQTYKIDEGWVTVLDVEPKLGDYCYNSVFGLGIIIMKNGEECFYSSHKSGGSITTPWKRNIGNDCKKIIVFIQD